MRTNLLAAVAAAGVAATPALADKLLIGNEGTYPPFSMVQPNGDLTGIEPDLTREMCKRMEAECEFVVMDFKALIPSLIQGKVDMVASQITPLPERKERALFSIPVVYNPDNFVVRKGSDLEFTPEGLAGLKIGLQRGSSHAKYVMENFPDVDPTYYDNPDQIQLDLISGRIDATFGPAINWANQLIDTPDGEGYVFAEGDFWSGDASMPLEERGSSWIVGKTNTELLDRMNEALTSMLEDCSFTKIREAYLSVPVIPAEAKCVSGGS